MFTKVFAHRGASKQAPENTMEAFKLAYELGADGIETDVQLTKDHVPVLIHDEHLKRTTDGTGYVKDLTWDQLKMLDAGSWFSSKFTGASILSLEEFLQWIQSKSLYLNIELKNNKIDYEHLESIVYEQVAYYQLLDRTIMSTFNPNSIKRMSSSYQAKEIALLTSKRNKNIIPYAKELGANALHIKYSLLRPKLVKQCKEENISIRVYTVNKRRRMIRCYMSGCDGIFTDVPDKALKYRNLVQSQ
ncbi:glycerophosphodiester phosphodiesterase [Virgibacillus alimentarius]|uniref:Glycerophosphoryl diester phosphodiesterase n=1 Tax=Virgibacillus alimentarius TaxID=698769 RepID=A0ABS4S4M4_9BACI|nr:MULTISPECIES: glycerophosphodiester phosphodiesterase [Virgibacillus]MBP2256443.1 glycerophosphoryl diester phosphodiesterase [Virgibacillus alimentarius]HLR66388.1 glycerophosphodiester phosphodiesterase [Virgibacillus sp.]